MSVKDLANIKAIINGMVMVAAALLLVSCSLTSNYAKKSYARAKKVKPYDVIIVPGLPYEKENTSAVMKERLFWAKHLYNNGFARNIIFSGSAVYSPFVESIAMKAMADSLGIPSEVMYCETEAEHSTENVYYSWKMAKGLGFKKIAVATDPYQNSLLRIFMKKHTPGVKSIPIVFDMLDIEHKQLPKIDTTAAYVKNFVPITERESFWERFRYTMGKRIKDEKKVEARRQKRMDTGSN